MANEPNATPPAGDPPATKATGDVKLRTRSGYNLVDGDLEIKDGAVVEVSASEAKRLLTKHPDYLVVVEEEKE